MDSDTFSKYANKLIEAGANIIGGCCGSTPEFIKKIVENIKEVKIPLINGNQGSIVSSERGYTIMGHDKETVIVGERINPTGKKILQGELKEGNINYVLQLAKEQIEKGAKILDVNVGMNGIDEVGMMKEVVAQLSVSVETPLCIDSSNIEAIETGLRIYPGRALVNSISLEKEKVEKLLPIAAKYGAMFILLPLDDNGLPKTIEDKHNIVRTVFNAAQKYGYKKEDIVVDGLVQTVASNKNAALETLATIEWCSEEFGCNTIMGLSNISFGLPERKYVNTSFLAMSITKGLTMAIANPSVELFMNIKFACDLLKTKDKDGLSYIKRFSQKDEDDENDKRSEVFKSVLTGEKDKIINDVEIMLEQNISPKEIVENHLITAITEVGIKFDKKEYFLPQLIRSAETMEVAMTKLEPLLFGTDKKDKNKKPIIVLATVKGDVHDIGKNLVGLMFKNHGFHVIDLGKDVDSELIVNKARETNADIIGLSALMTTTMTEMKVVVDKAKEEKIKAKIMIGGAVITESYAEEINADAYSEDANEAVKVAKELLTIE
jgi:5-methyltetrahydrofolate--homocysteine methyltransferase